MFRAPQFLLIWLATVNCQNFFDNSIFESTQFEQREIAAPARLDIDDPLAYWWNNKHSAVQNNYATCTVKNPWTGNDRTGVCMHSTECRFTGGGSYSRGSCNFRNTCCVYDKPQRNATIRARVAYFKSPGANPREAPTHTMRLQVLNENVCQIRVDINKLTLQDPAPPADTSGLFSVECEVDRFTAGTRDPDVRLPEICGTQENTHFYIHLNRNNLNRYVTFIVSLGPTGTITPSWDIKVTQLECPGSETLSNSIQHKKDNKNQPYEDFDNLAPQGCLQYFTAPTGSFHSFGWNTNFMDSSLTTNQDYAICFKRVPSYCGIRFTTHFFGIWDTPLIPPINPILCRYSYIYTPETRTVANRIDDDEKRCPDVTTANTTPTTWTTEHPGPLYIHFHVDSQVMSTIASNLAPVEGIRRGFNITYDSNTDCTPIQFPP